MFGILRSHRRQQYESSDDESSTISKVEEEEEAEVDISEQLLPTRFTFPSILGHSMDMHIQREKEEEDSDNVSYEEESEDDDEKVITGYEDDEIDEEEREKEKYLKSLTVPILKEKLRERKLKLSGRKDVLIDRLLGREESTKVMSNNIICDMTEENLKQLKNAELKDLLKRRKMSTSGKKSVMIKRLLGEENGKAKKWKKSLAQSLLRQLINDERSRIHTMDANEIWESDPIFQQYPLDKFEEYVTTLKEADVNETEIAMMNEEEIWKEMLAYPRGELTDRGIPFWDTHDAKSLLDEDVRDGTADRLKPKELRETRQPYKKFPLSVFRPHIYQVRRRQREEPGWVERRNKIAQKIHENERNALSREWDVKRKDDDLNDLCIMFERAW